MSQKNNLIESIVNRKPLFRGKYLFLERLEVKLPDGRRGEREVVRVKDAVAVLPLDTEGNVHLVRQYRAAIGRTLLEVPAGLLDEGESCQAAAVRECEEETGYRPGKLKQLLTYAHAEGYSTGFITLFLGIHLEHTGKMHLDATEFVEPVCMPFHDLLRLVRENRIVDSKTILSTLLSEALIAD